jgi:hypothetical protein
MATAKQKNTTTPSERNAQRGEKREGNTVSINIEAVKEPFEILAEHCKKEAPWMNITNADVARFAIMKAAESLGGSK